MKSYPEQNYKFELDVIVTFFKADGSIDFIFEDGIKGLNKGHALYLAQQNWVGAKIEPLELN